MKEALFVKTGRSKSEIFSGGTHEIGPGSVAGILNGYGLDGPGIESWWGARFSAPDNGYRVFPGGKERPGRDADPSPPSSAVVMKK